MALSEQIKHLIKASQKAGEDHLAKVKLTAQALEIQKAARNNYIRLVGNLQLEARKGMTEGMIERVISLDNQAYLIQLMGPPSEGTLRIIPIES